MAKSTVRPRSAELKAGKRGKLIPPWEHGLTESEIVREAPSTAPAPAPVRGSRKVRERARRAAADDHERWEDARAAREAVKRCAEYPYEQTFDFDQLESEDPEVAARATLAASEFCRRWLKFWVASAPVVRESVGAKFVRSLAGPSRIEARARDLYLRIILAKDPAKASERVLPTLVDAWIGAGSKRYELVFFFRRLLERMPAMVAIERKTDEEGAPPTDRERVVLLELYQCPPGMGKNGPELLFALDKAGNAGITMNRLTSDIIPSLRKRLEVPNPRGGVGYYLTPSDRKKARQLLGY